MIIIHFKNGSSVSMINPANVTSKDIDKRINDEFSTTLRLYNYVFNFSEVSYVEVLD